MNKQDSYQSANVFPVKVLYDTVLIDEMVHYKRIIPRVLQVTPTNVCDLKCSYCCCSELNRKQSLSFDQMEEIALIGIDLGVRAVVLSGGGEPLCHPRILDIINSYINKGLKIGLITNGNHFKDNMIATLSNLTWCRISFDNEREFTDKYIDSVNIASEIKSVNWSFSYVMNKEDDIENLKTLINIANLNKHFSNIRVVTNTLEKESFNIDESKELLIKAGYDISKCMFIGKQSYRHGSKNCYISLLKPKINADGMVYACGAVRYLENEKLKYFPTELAMGHYRDLPSMIEKQSIYDGSNCFNCCYTGYNECLETFMKADEIEHWEFL